MTVTKIGVADLRENLSDIMDRVHFMDEHVIVERHGKPKVAIVSLDDYRLLAQLRSDAEQRRVDRLRKTRKIPV